MNVPTFLRFLSRKQRTEHIRAQYQKHRPYVRLNAEPAEGKGTEADDTAIVERLLASYQLAGERSFYGEDSMWREFFEEHHAEEHAAFSSGDVERSRQILSNPRSTKLFWGFDELVDSYYESFAASEAVRNHAAQVCQDYFLRLAEAIGAYPIDNPESNVWLRHADVSAAQLLTDIERILGIDIVEPDVYPGRFGVNTPRGVVSYRAIQSVYLAYRLHQLLEAEAESQPRICEIGAGLGRPALYAWRYGLRDYTIVDLPFTGISQGYYLMRCLGADAVQLHGESFPDSDRRIKLMHPDGFLEGDRAYDLVVNVDSLTELGRELATQYVKKIASSCPRFLSINHEVNEIRVHELVRELGDGPRIVRHPYWMRPGYVEELVTFGG